MRPIKCPWPPANWSAGSGWWTSAAARSCGPSFSPSVFNQVGAGQVQACLRDLFGGWGLPAALRLDNGLPWGPLYELPPALALWLAGLGITLHFIPVGQKQLNGVIERSQGTGQRWGEPWTCATPAELQQRLDALDQIQREEYPSLQGRSRWAVFPQLRHSGRTYTPQGEAAQWELRRAQEYLAGHTAGRRVNRQGQVWIYGRRYSVGVKHRGQAVWVYYDAGSEEWVISEDGGRVLRRLRAMEITQECIMGLQVSP